jgi:hypothetical protein
MPQEIVITREHLARLVNQSREVLHTTYLTADGLSMPQELKSAVIRAQHSMREVENYLKIMKSMEGAK